MKKTIAVVAADTHLDQLIWRNRPEIYGDSFFGFTQLVDKAIELGVPLIIAGDFLECLPTNAPSSEVIGMLYSQLRRLQLENIPFFFVNGQHDLTPGSRKPWPLVLGFPDGYLDQRVIILRAGDGVGVTVSGVSWVNSKVLPAVIRDTPAADVVICHQVWKELMGTSSAEGSLSGFDAKLIISGDFHQFKSVQVKNRNDQDATAISPGATHMRKINEPANYYGVLLYDDLSVEKFKLRSRQKLSFDVHTEKSLEDFYDTLGVTLDQIAQRSVEQELWAELCVPILAVNDHSNLRDVRSRMETVLGNRVHLFYKRMDVDTGNLLGEPTAIEFPSATTLLMDFAMQECGDDLAASSLMRACLSGENLRDDIKKERESYLTGT